MLALLGFLQESGIAVKRALCIYPLSVDSEQVLTACQMLSGILEEVQCAVGPALCPACCDAGSLLWCLVCALLWSVATVPWLSTFGGRSWIYKRSQSFLVPF